LPSQINGKEKYLSFCYTQANSTMKFQIDSQVLAKWPEVKIGVVVALGVDNTKGKEEILKLLGQQQLETVKEFSGQDIKQHPFIACWRQVYKDFGAKPNKYPSSVEALVKRVANGGNVPNINPLVNIYNYLSLKHVLPYGGEDLDKVVGDIVLKICQGNESGTYIGSDKIENCRPGEVAYCDQTGFICRRWNWREADRTKLTPETKNVVLVVEAMPPAQSEQLKEAIDELVGLVSKFLGGKTETFVLDKNNSACEFNFQSKVVNQKKAPKKSVEKKQFKAKPTESQKWNLSGPKDSLAYQLQEVIAKAVNSVQGPTLRPEEVKLEHPANEAYGDWSTNIAMTIKGKILRLPGVSSFGKTQDKHRAMRAQTFGSEAQARRDDTIALKKFSDRVKQKNNEIIQQSSNPVQVAEAIKTELEKQKPDFIEKITVLKPGFINISIKNEWLINQLTKVIKEGENHGKTKIGDSKKVMVEFAHPNTHKAFHIGHLRNIFTGEAVVKILENNGCQVVRTNYQGDVGIHIAKCLWGIKQDKDFSLKASQSWTLEQKAKYMGKAYVIGSDFYEKNKKAAEEIKDINYLIYAAAQKYQQKEHGIQPGSTNYMRFVKGSRFSLEEIYQLWVETRQWSLDYFDSIYKRVDSHFDRCYFESQCLGGIDACYEALEKGILTKSQGAIVFDGTKYGLDTRVFVNSLGLPTYEGKELGLAPMEMTDFGHIDKIIHVVTPEQSSFFQVTFKVEELLGIQEDQQYHLAYNWVKLKQGKMSSRVGNVILGEWVLDEAKVKLKKSFPKTNEDTLEKIAVGAVKYAFLKTGTANEIAFDFDESISLEGNSGPYLQYTYARCRSVLEKAGLAKGSHQVCAAGATPHLVWRNWQGRVVNPEELAVLRTIYKFPEVVWQAGKDLAPNVICSYLYNLAGKYNTFYNKYRILETQNSKLKTQNYNAKLKSEKTNFRLLLTAATAQIIKNGLYLLGIKTLEKM
jgi:arginyl-tRNA synthetase